MQAPRCHLVTRPRAAIVGTLISSALLAACGWLPSTDHTGSESSTGATLEVADVDRVVDGDTIILLIDDQAERVRLIGVDSPESVSRDTPDQCFGAEASEALQGLLPPGTEVRIVRDEEPRDRYGRLLLYLYRVSDDLFVNQWLVDGGFADAVSYRPNVTFELDFADRRDVAREGRVGLWGACDGPDQPLP